MRNDSRQLSLLAGRPVFLSDFLNRIFENNQSKASANNLATAGNATNDASNAVNPSSILLILTPYLMTQHRSFGRVTKESRQGDGGVR